MIFLRGQLGSLRTLLLSFLLLILLESKCRATFRRTSAHLERRIILLPAIFFFAAFTIAAASIGVLAFLFELLLVHDSLVFNP